MAMPTAVLSAGADVDAAWVKVMSSTLSLRACSGRRRTTVWVATRRVAGKSGANITTELGLRQRWSFTSRVEGSTLGGQ
eukprot:760566-Pleurochrysis_carterae.AAC.3